MDEQKRTLEKEIKLLEKRYSFLNMFKADDTDGHQRLLETRKTCLLNLIQKQDTLMKLQSEVKV